MRRALVGIVGVLVLAGAIGLAAGDRTPTAREAARPAPLTWDTFHVLWTECTRPFRFELGTSTMVVFDPTVDAVVVRVSGSPADHALEAELQACVDGYPFDGAVAAPAVPMSPFHELLVGAYSASVVENCFIAHGFAPPAREPWTFGTDNSSSRANPYLQMTGDPGEIAELRRDCPPYPGFLLPDLPVR